MRLIDLNKIPHKAFRGDRDDLVDALFAAPTVDAVPVVRCKDCKYYLHSNEKCELIDTRLHFYETRNRWTDDDFCAWGKRKGGDE